MGWRVVGGGSESSLLEKWRSGDLRMGISKSPTERDCCKSGSSITAHKSLLEDWEEMLRPVWSS